MRFLNGVCRVRKSANNFPRHVFIARLASANIVHVTEPAPGPTLSRTAAHLPGELQTLTHSGTGVTNRVLKRGTQLAGSVIHATSAKPFCPARNRNAL